MISVKCIYSIIFFTLITFSVKSQVLPAPNRLRCDFLLDTEKVSRYGIQVNEPLASALNQKDKYQFAIIYNKQPIFNWEVDT
jgi:hypothetical protein